MPFSYGLDEFLDDLQVGSGMKGQASCPLEVVPFIRTMIDASAIARFYYGLLLTFAGFGYKTLSQIGLLPNSCRTQMSFPLLKNEGGVRCHL